MAEGGSIMDRMWATGGSRRAFVEGAVLIGSGAVVGGLVLARGSETAASAASKVTDRKILTFALMLERLQVAFYQAMLAKRYATGEIRQYAETVHGHEVAHAQRLTEALGGAGIAPVSFTFGGALASRGAFTKAAIVVEDMGAAAYDGQIPNLTPSALRLASEIVSVESRHAAWIRDIAGESPAPVPADPPATVQQVRSKLRSLGISIGGA
jgi:hypothetical protein